MASKRGRGNKVVSLGPGSIPATLAAALVEHHKDIERITAVVTWKSGESEVFNSACRNIDLVWDASVLVDRVNNTVHGDDGT